MAFLPIAEISPWVRKGWTIKARVTTRQSTPRTIKKKDGRDGKVLSFELLDREGCEIRANLWDEAVTKWDSYLKPGRVYTFSGGSVRLSNRNFTQIRHQYDLGFFDADTKIVMVENDDAIGAVQFKNIVSLREIATKPVPCVVNVCGLLTDVKEGNVANVKRDGTSTEVFVRKVFIVDSSECTLEVSLWADAARKPGLVEGSVIIIKGMRVTDFSGRNGSCTDSSNLFVEPDAPEVQPLKDWYAANSGITFRALSSGERSGAAGERKVGDLAAFADESSNLQEGQTIYWNCKAYLAYVRTQNKEKQPLPLWYAACPTCMRKIDMEGNCVKCDKRVARPDLRFMIASLILEDDTAQQWVGAFDEGCKALLGTTPDALSESFKDEDLSAKMGKIQKLVGKKYYSEELEIKLRAKVDVYNGVMRAKPQILSANKIDYKTDMATMLKGLNEAVAGASEDAQAEVNAMLTDETWLEHAAGLPAVQKELDSLRAVAVA